MKRINTHIVIDGYTIVHRAIVEKVTLNRDKSKGWLKIHNDPKLIHLTPEQYKIIVKQLMGGEFSNDLNIEDNVEVSSYSKPHKFDPVMEDKTLCCCGKHENEVEGLHIK